MSPGSLGTAEGCEALAHQSTSSFKLGNLRCSGRYYRKRTRSRSSSSGSKGIRSGNLASGSVNHLSTMSVIARTRAS